MILTFAISLGEIPSTFLFQDTLERRLAPKVHVKSHMYQVCPNGCQMYQKNDTVTLNCKYCDTPRYSDVDSKTPAKLMKMASVGDRMAGFLVNNTTREKMQYRHRYQHEEGVYKDYFDGEVYKSLKKNTLLFESEDDAAVALFFDGFQGTTSTGDKLSIIHLVNMNIPPEYR